MSTAQALVERALDRLAQHPGFAERPAQRHLALLISDLIESSATGAFEAPTGLGKSLAILIPAIAHGLADGKRTVVGTYTNVLAEQYWRQDFPLALSLFDDVDGLKRQFLIGRQRYACLEGIKQHDLGLYARVKSSEVLGIESEFRTGSLGPKGRFSVLWQAIATPVVCHGRLCPQYDACYYYQARKGAQGAHVVITNHSVILQNALLSRATEEEASLLGEFDFLVLDEAHDFSQAAENGLEFELSASRLNSIASLAGSLQRSLASLSPTAAPETERIAEEFRKAAESLARAILNLNVPAGKVLVANPPELENHPAVLRGLDRAALDSVRGLAESAALQTERFTSRVRDVVGAWSETQPSLVWQAQEATRSYFAYLDAFAFGCRRLLSPEGVAVSHLGGGFGEPFVRQDIIALAEPLRELVWDRTPWACVSATLAIDGDFAFFARSTGATPAFTEVLPSPFDFERQAAAYLPKEGAIPDPSVARREGTEEIYYRCIARELDRIIRLLGGRTLALFHSRKEMEAVAALMDLPPELPIFIQPRAGAASTGDKFIRQIESSLFALRSFWTGFDAAGETLSCVALVRVPFEVPIDPPQLARSAWIESQGMEPFATHSLPIAKMLMRQGAGRLIRTHQDRGVVALLDPRLRTKRYGEEIISNLPVTMRVFDDFGDAAGWLQLGNVTTVPTQSSNP